MSSNVEVHRFSWSGLEPFTRLFNAVCGYESTPEEHSPDSMRELLGQPSGAPQRDIFVTSLESTPVGFLHVSPELRIGRAVAAGGVLEPYRGRGVEGGLIASAVEHSASLGARVLHMQVSSSDVTTHEALRSAGFESVATYWNMRREAAAVPQPGLPQGYTLRPFTLGRDEDALTDLQNAAFGDTWGFCPNTVDEVAFRVRMSRSDPEGILLILDSDIPAAYCWTTRSENRFGSIGWISMVGVRPEYRGEGIGRAALAAGMTFLRGKGVEGIELEVDSLNVPARKLYDKLGFRKTSETIWFERRLA